MKFFAGWPILWRRWVFAGYAVLLFTGTHWPKLRIPGPEIRSDLVIHFVAFGTWVFLFAAAAWVGSWKTLRGLAWPLVIGIAYAGFDEGLQAIPALGRTCAWDDFAANCGGIVLGIGASWLVGRKADRALNN